jgi:hypothetical protein
MTTLEIFAALAATYAALKRYIKVRGSASLTITLTGASDHDEA